MSDRDLLRKIIAKASEFNMAPASEENPMVFLNIGGETAIIPQRTAFDSIQFILSTEAVLNKEIIITGFNRAELKLEILCKNGLVSELKADPENEGRLACFPEPFKIL